MTAPPCPGAPVSSRSLTVLRDTFAVCRLAPAAPLPPWVGSGDFLSITRTPEELSLVCPERDVPADIQSTRGWACLKVEGPLDFSLTGVLATLAGTLAEAGVPLFAISTYDTDYLLVRENDLARAEAALTAAGHRVSRPSPAQPESKYTPRTQRKA